MAFYKSIIGLSKSVCALILLIPICVYSQQEKQFTLLKPQQTGINFENTIVDTRESNILIYSNFYGGAGVGIGDFNNDGLQDIFFAGNLVGDRLYKNNGNLKFEDITAKAYIQDNGGWSSGVVIGDINNDGWQDIYVTRELYDNKVDLRKNKLYINTTKDNSNGNITFREMSREYGLDNSERTRHAAFLDYNNDGLLDVLLLNQPPNPGNFSSMYGTDLKQMKYAPRLYKNNGKEAFVDVTEHANLLKPGFANSISILDANNDGWQDIYISNDFEAPDIFYLNNADGTFDRVTDEIMGHISYFGMGVDSGDINNDGLLDVMVLDMVAEDNFRIKSNMSGMNPNTFWKIANQGGHYQYMFNTLQLNMGLSENRPHFGDIAQLAGVSSTDWSWSNLIGDFDNDGLKDIHVTNGLLRDIRNTDSDKAVSKYVQKVVDDFVKNNPNMGAVDIWDILDLEETLDHIPSVKLANYSYKNKNGLQFEKVSKQWGLDQRTFSAGSAYGDLDNDGDLDLVINNVNEVAFVYRNNAEKMQNQHYLRVFLTDKKNNSPMLGAKVEAMQNGVNQTYAFTSVRGMYSTSEHAAHFGFPKPTTIDTLKITWPNQQVSVLTNIEPNRVLYVDFNEAPKQGKETKKSRSKLFDVAETLPLEHRENIFDDFDKQVLLPHKLSQSGPALTVGDVNNDGLDDIYVGAAAGIQPSILLQDKNGSFYESTQDDALLKGASKYEDVDAVFFDADADGDQDLYVVSGGNEWKAKSELYQDRLYFNDGTGRFREHTLPKLRESGSVVRPFDYDQDGDIDLFVGGRHKPWDYPSPVSSRILKNEQGVFTDVTSSIAKDLLDIGLVTDAVWTDFNNDGLKDFVLTGEWMPITFFQNTGDKFVNVTTELGMEQTTGWWYGLTAADMDNDGDDDIIAGNLGLNYKYKAEKGAPFEVHYRDFDHNGKKDIVLSYYNFGEQYPLRGRSCSSQQVPAIAQRFKTYDVFASANLVDVYGEGNLNAALHYNAQTFASTYFKNNGNGEFEIQSLPLDVQISNIDQIIVDDFDDDGIKDVLVAGNMFPVEVETTRNDAGVGMFLKGSTKNGFVATPMEKSGVFLPDDVNKLRKIKVNGQKKVLVGVNNGPIKIMGY